MFFYRQMFDFSSLINEFTSNNYWQYLDLLVPLLIPNF